MSTRLAGKVPGYLGSLGKVPVGFAARYNLKKLFMDLSKRQFNNMFMGADGTARDVSSTETNKI